jgi:3-methyladenine DNA glycosylase AlkD
MKRYLREIQERVATNAPSGFRGPEAFRPENYVGGGRSRLRYLAYRAPDLRRIAKQEFSFSHFSLDEQFKIWTQNFLTDDSFEGMSLSLYWLDEQDPDFLLKKWSALKTWSKAIDNWGHGDSLCSVYARLLEVNSGLVLPTLKAWNKSKKESWLVRVSMLSLLYYSRQRKKYPSASLVENFLKPHWYHQDYYVQKAIGWTLREYISAYPQRGQSFLTKNILQVSAVAFTAAAERLTPPQKTKLKNLRKKSRGIAS